MDKWRASPIYIHLSELRLCYELDITFKRIEQQMMYGKIMFEEVPTLTGWIKFWRKLSKDPKYQIIYKPRNEK